MLLLVTPIVVIMDQWTKHLVMSHMELGQSLVFLDGFFQVTYVRNPGAAFGLLPYQTGFFIAATLLVSLLILYYFWTLGRGYCWIRLGLALQLGGALGNLIDRLREGYVIDFLDFSLWPPVFNLADVAIVVGVALFLFSFWHDIILQQERS